MNELTQKELKRLLHYDPDTGNFTRLVGRQACKIGDIAGSTNGSGYIHIKINNKVYKAHRLAFLYMEGKLPEKIMEVDHINHKKIDNRWVNLRLVTRQGNNKNSSLRKDNKAGQTGVYRNKATNKWQANIRVNGKLKHLGCFDNLDDATDARKAAEIKYNFHENHGQQST